LAAILAPLRAAPEADADKEARPVSAALGLKLGVIPPVLVAPELVVHAPHLFLGVFAIVTGGGLGEGGDRLTLGGELGYEFARPGRSTPYLLGTILHYEAAQSASIYSEEAEILSLTAGYEWKERHLELQLGAGVFFLLRDQIKRVPCTGWFCPGFSLPPYVPFPAFDLSVRYGF
jgi:hypothetical protein